MRNKKVLLAFALICCMLMGCAFSFSAYSTKIKAKGNVAGGGKFDVVFDRSKLFTTSGQTTTGNTLAIINGSSEVKVKVSSLTGDANNNTDDKLNLAITVPANHTDPVTFKVPVKSNSTVTAKAAIASNSNNKYEISSEAVEITAGDTAEIAVTFKAKSASVGDTGNITLDIVFEQIPITGKPHASHTK